MPKTVKAYRGIRIGAINIETNTAIKKVQIRIPNTKRGN